MYVLNHINRCCPTIETIAMAQKRWGPDKCQEISSAASQEISDSRIAMASWMLPVITIFAGGYTIPKWVVYDIVLDTFTCLYKDVSRCFFV